LPNKQCSSDPQPTWLLKANADILLPFLCQLFSSCLEHGTVLSSFKSGLTQPMSYRIITNLSVISKLLERLVTQQLTTYLTDNGLLPDIQSAYHAHHLTETAVC